MAWTKRTVWLAPAVCVVCVSGLGASAIAQSEGSGVTAGSHKQVTSMPVDVPVPESWSRAVDDLSDWLARNQEEATGWTGVRHDLDHSLSVYWVGEIPDSLRVALSRSGAKVHYVKSDWTSQELTDAIRNLLESGLGLFGAFPDDAYDGVVAESANPNDKTLPTEIRGIPIRYVEKQFSAKLAAGRRSDTPPFYGGAQVLIPSNGSICGLAFAVTTPAGDNKLITARHCGQSTTYTTPASTPVTVGTSGGGDASTDSTLIANSTLSIMAVGWLYTGSWDSTTSLPVLGPRVPVTGDGMCADGAWSGQRCRNTIGVTDYQVYVSQLGRSIGPGFWATNVDDVSQAGLGDSGSPAMKLYSAPDGVRVLGMINAIDTTSGALRTCQGFDGGRVCSRSIFYTNVQALLYQHGVSLTTVSP